METSAHQSRARTRVAIVDDHPLMRAGLTALIAREPDLEVCGEAGTLREARALFPTCIPDLAIVDLSLPDGSGLDLIKRLRAQGDSTPVLVCSMHEETLFARRALAAGAQGYICKLEATAHVLEAIRRILDQQIYLSAPMRARLLLGLVNDTEAASQSPLDALTDREIEVLTLLGRGYKTKQIARELNLGVKTVETHREKLKRKLDLANGSELVCFAAQWVAEGGRSG
jgi:DNA-binding NarL/FixJ family response regulator